MGSSLVYPTPIQSIADPRVASSYYETPFIYNKNYYQAYLASAPPSGPSGALIDAIKSDGDSDFFARRALAVLNFNDMSGSTFITAIGNQNANSFIGLDIPIAPEKLFTLGADIPILLQQTNGQIDTNVAFLQYPLGGGDTAIVSIAGPMFQGVKRFGGAPNNTPNYPFFEKPYTYCLQFTQDWTFLVPPYSTLQVAAPRTFIKTVLNYDFELWAITLSGDYYNYNTGQNAFSGYMMKLYDANGYALMKDFVHYTFLAYNGGYSGTSIPADVPGGTKPWYPNCFPCPPVVYPKGSNIQLDVLSLLDTITGGGGASLTQYINFWGVNRIPC